MSFRQYLLCSLLCGLPWLLSGQYYYVESGCTSCRLTPGGRIGNYWMISAQSHPFTMGGGEREIELIAGDFRAELAGAYVNYPALSNGLAVVRDMDREAAEMARRRRVTERRRQGYEVVERPFWFLSHRGIPSVDNYLVYAERLGFDGVVLIAENDWVVHRRGYGRAREIGALPHHPHTAFPIGGLTKAFTAQAIFLLREAGRIDLSDNLGKFFRQAPADKKSITVKQLLMHTSGLPRETPPGDYEASSEVLDAILDTKLLALPGEEYRYSDMGYQLLALIIQKITRQTYDEFLREQIIEPFQLRQTGFLHQPPHPRLVADEWTASGLDPFAPPPVSSYVYLGSDGLVSTAEDLFRWFRTLSKLPFFAEMARYQNGRDMAYGFRVTAEGLVIGEGAAGPYYTQLTYDRTRRRLILLLSNSEPPPAGVRGAALSRHIQEIMEGGRRETIQPAAIPAGSFAGVYADGADTLRIIPENDRLRFTVTGRALLEDITTGGPLAAEPALKDRTERCHAALSARNWDALKTILPAEEAEQLQTFITERETELGRMTGVLDGGIRRLPGAGHAHESWLYFSFGRHVRAARLQWEEDRLREITSALGRPAALYGYLLLTSARELTYLDLLSDYRRPLRLSSDGRTIFLGERRLERGSDN